MISASRSEPSDSAVDPAPAETPELLTALAEHLRELQEYAAYYLSAQADRLRLQVRNLVIALVLATLALTVAASLAATAAVLLLVGIGQGLGQLFGGREWLGFLATGLGLLVGSSLVAWWLVHRISRSSFAETMHKYAVRQAEQQREFGRDVSSRTRARYEPRAN